MVDYQGFIGIVSGRARVTADEAERAACATVQTLAERLTTGEMDDIAEGLPDELRRCIDGAGPFEAFLALVADREGVDRGQATEHARAVLDILREVTGEEEFHDTTAQLPGEYRVLLRKG